MGIAATVSGGRTHLVKNSAQTLMYLESCSIDEASLPKLILLNLYLPSRQNGWRLLECIKTHYLY
jgi:hypothetical protein